MSRVRKVRLIGRAERERLAREQALLPPSLPAPPRPRGQAVHNRFTRPARFAAEYLIDGNGVQAAIRAGYPRAGANSAATRLLNHPRVRADIAARSHERFARAGLTPERVLEEIARIAFAALPSFFGRDGRPLTLADMDDDMLAALSWADIDRDGRTVLAVQPLGKLFALDLLVRHFGLIGRYN